MAGFAAAAEASPFGVWAAESALAYPMANIAHVLGAIVLVGAIGLLDLRVLGLARGAALVPLRRALIPLGLAGFAVMVVSGSVLFVADAVTLAGSSVFGAKLVLIALAGLNALAFHRVFRADAEPTPTARTLAATSLLFWIMVVIAGRWIAYA